MRSASIGVELLEARDVPSYLITDLGVLPKHDTSTAFSVNLFGHVVGVTQRPGSSRAVLWSDGAVTDLGGLGGEASFAYSLNYGGEVVGSATISKGGLFHAFLLSGGLVYDLEPAGGPEANSSARAINIFGDVVGERQLVEGGAGRRAFLYRQGTLTDLNDLIPPGGDWVLAQARQINDDGRVVGQANDLDGQNLRGFVYSAGDVTILGTLGGGFSEAFDINLANQVVGSATTADESTRAFIWQNGVMFNLGTLDGGDFSTAAAINNFSQVVGSSATPDGFRAFLWQQGVMTDLNSLLPAGSGWVVSDAYGINDLGQIVGEGEINGQFHAFLMTPAPGGAPGAGQPPPDFGAEIAALLHAAGRKSPFAGP